MPPSVVAGLNGNLVKALNVPELRTKLEQSGLAVVAGTPEQFAAPLKRSLELYAQATKLAGSTPE